MGFLDGRVGGFLSNVGDTLGNVTDVLSRLPNRIIDFGISLGNKQAEFLSQNSETIQEEQRQFQTRQASFNLADFINKNPVLVFSGIGLVLYLIFKK